MYKDKKHFGLLLMFVCILLLPLMSSAQKENKPEIYIEKMVYDFGKVFVRPTFEHKFIVRNKGKADLIISNVKPG